MSKRKQETVNLDLGSKESLALPLAAAGRSKPERADEIEDSRHNDLCYRNCDERYIEERKEARASSRRVQLTALSKVVNTAFTGWTIKTQS
ncbi:hypothetical protein C6502_07935 [Candidatus Poribacteria bacterium]|nr:MAG: hypothetical protein C6502_07935 [Candidatus Poribacteria bacterium]